MRKNARWSGMGVSGLRMGGLGNSMGLRSARMQGGPGGNNKDANMKDVSSCFVNIYMLWC
jgi:brefeldin A-resistance guanine nucleotide exchange factor 1